MIPLTLVENQNISQFFILMKDLVCILDDKTKTTIYNCQLILSDKDYIKIRSLYAIPSRDHKRLRRKDNLPR